MNSPAVGAAALLTRRAPWPARIVAYAVALLEVVRVAVDAGTSMDNLLVVRAVRNLADGVSPYVGDRFLYPPSSIPFALLQTRFSDAALVRVMPFAIAGALLLGWWASLRLFDVGLGSWLGVLGVGAAPLLRPYTNALDVGAWTAFVAGLAAVALLLMGRQRWLAAGLVVGLSIAIKPMLMPLGLIFLLERRWGGFAAAAGLPVLTCAAVVPFLPQPELFFTKTVPFLLGGQDDFARLYDSSLQAVLPRLGVSGGVVSAVRLAVFVVMIGVAVLRWYRSEDRRVQLVEMSAVLMVGTFLVMTPVFDHYVLVVVPPLVASVVARGAVARTSWFWITLAPTIGAFHYPFVDFENDGQLVQRQAFRTFAWAVALLAVLVVVTWVRRDDDSAAGTLPAPRDGSDADRQAPGVEPAASSAGGSAAR